ncbi:MAG: hypothetical protein ACXAC7_17420 [Candidatus Hodarchaeales archaeon]|jgi:hypothetical protein
MNYDFMNVKNSKLCLSNFAFSVLAEAKELKNHVINNSIHPKDLSWVIKTQRKLNGYIDDFQLKFSRTNRTVKVEEELSNLQAEVINNCHKTLPEKGELSETLFFPKLLEVFAIHNRFLSTNWAVD